MQINEKYRTPMTHVLRRSLGLVALLVVCISGCSAWSEGSGRMVRSVQDVEVDVQESPMWKLLVEDDFRVDRGQLKVEFESPGRVEVGGGVLVVDVPAGCTVWYRVPVTAPVRIKYDVTPISAGGPNDRVSDVNCFLLARDSRGPGTLDAYPRNGQFADYNYLLGYYVGHGGNTNSTTRMRRYHGGPEQGPLLPEHDLREPKFLLTPNRKISIELTFHDNTLTYAVDGEVWLTLRDPQPHLSGWFGWRTVNNHMRIENLRIYGPVGS